MKPAGVIGRIAPWHQTNWDWRAAGNFIGGGSGAGLLAFAALSAREDYATLALIALALIGAGLLCVWAEIGRPWRALNVFKHARTSWMTREALVAGALFPAALAAAAFGGLALMVLAAALGIAFLYCQARILPAARGIPAWRQPLVSPLILVTGLAEGAAWFVLARGLFGGAAAASWPAWVLAGFVLLRLAVWRVYLRRLECDRAPQRALQVLGRFDLLFLALGGFAFIAALAGASSGIAPLGELAGLLAVIAGWALKFVLVTRAAFNQGFALPRVPTRGAGGGAGPVHPGWGG